MKLFEFKTYPVFPEDAQQSGACAPRGFVGVIWSRQPVTYMLTWYVHH